MPESTPDTSTRTLDDIKRARDRRRKQDDVLAEWTTLLGLNLLGQSSEGIGPTYRTLVDRVGQLVLQYWTSRQPTAKEDLGTLHNLLKKEIGDEEGPRKRFLEDWLRAKNTANGPSHGYPSRLDTESLNPLIASVRYLEETLQRLNQSVTATQLENVGKPAVERSAADSNTPNVIIAPSDGHRFKVDITSWLNDGLKSAFRDNLSGAVRTVTPVIGNGVMQIGSQDEQVDWSASFQGDLAEIGEDLEKYVDSLRTSRLDGRSLNFIKVGDDDDQVDNLRLVLSRLSFSTTKIFVRSWASNLTPLSDWERHGVEVQVDHELGELLQDAIREASKVSSTDHQLLGAPSIRERLLRLQREFESSSKTFMLTSAHVAFLADLLWHTIIYRSRLYPRPDELALQVSLLLKNPSPIRKLEPGLAVARSTFSDLQDAVKLSIMRGFNDQDVSNPRASFQATDRAEFVASIARILHAESRRNQRVLATKHSSRVGTAAIVGPEAICISSTFDLELERALAVTGPNGAHFYVAFPVLMWSEGSANNNSTEVKGHVRWILGEFECRDQPTIEDLIAPRGGWYWLDSANQDHSATNGRSPSLSGPLLLKINGSPAHKLPERVAESDTLRRHRPTAGSELAKREAEVDESTHLNHSVLLGEFDLMQFQRIDQWAYDTLADAPAPSTGGLYRQGLPSWVAQAIRARGRRSLYLGQGLKDWNSRMRIYTQLSRSAAGGTKAVAVCRHFDEDRSLILNWLGVQRVEGECEALTEPLNDFARFIDTEETHR